MRPEDGEDDDDGIEKGPPCRRGLPALNKATGKVDDLVLWNLETK